MDIKRLIRKLNIYRNYSNCDNLHEKFATCQSLNSKFIQLWATSMTSSAFDLSMYLGFTCLFLQMDILFVQFKMSVLYFFSIQKKSKSKFLGENVSLFSTPINPQRGTVNYPIITVTKQQGSQRKKTGIHYRSCYKLKQHFALFQGITGL